MQYLKSKLTIGLVALLLASGATLWGVSSYQANQNSTATSQNQTAQTAAESKAGRTEITYTAQPGITSLEQLKREAKDVVVSESEYGELVDSIEGHKGGVDGKYWSFYVNGEMAQVGAGSYMQKEGDVVEWKFQKL